jgi:hypothetical protein
MIAQTRRTTASNPTPILVTTLGTTTDPDQTVKLTPTSHPSTSNLNQTPRLSRNPKHLGNPAHHRRGVHSHLFRKVQPTITQPNRTITRTLPAQKPPFNPIPIHAHRSRNAKHGSRNAEDARGSHPPLSSLQRHPCSKTRSPHLTPPFATAPGHHGAHPLTHAIATFGTNGWKTRPQVQPLPLLG